MAANQSSDPRSRTRRAQYDQMALIVAYCRILSPFDGIVAKRSVEVGQNVTPGQEVVLVAPTNALLVPGNFRETRLSMLGAGGASGAIAGILASCHPKTPPGT